MQAIDLLPSNLPPLPELLPVGSMTSAHNGEVYRVVRVAHSTMMRSWLFTKTYRQRPSTKAQWITTYRLTLSISHRGWLLNLQKSNTDAKVRQLRQATSRLGRICFKPGHTIVCKTSLVNVEHPKRTGICFGRWNMKLLWKKARYNIT